MRVSVIVPLYNKAKYVMRALASIAGQTCGDYEVIVVDDGSTDGSGELAAGFGDARFRVVQQANAGPGAARNRGVAEAQGDLIAFLDADDAWLPEYLESSVRLLEACGPEVATVTSGYIDFPPGVSREALWRRRGITEGIQKVTPSTPIQKLVHMLAYMWPCSTVARVEVLRRWGGFYDRNSCRYGEDALLFLKVLLNESVCFHMRPLAQFHRDASSLSGRYQGTRPVEPFLLDPDEVASACPAELLPLLRQFYAARAAKTAGVLGYWGDCRNARRLFRQFVSWHDWRLPFFLPGLVGCTPLARIFGPPLLAAARPLLPGGHRWKLHAGGSNR
ncbi:MAG: glycosyltransferase family 2 protein [Bryobacteraceae bacterium]